MKEEEESVIMVIKLASTDSHRTMTKRCVSTRIKRIYGDTTVHSSKGDQKVGCSKMI